MKMMKYASGGVNVGLENLALAFGTIDVYTQGKFISELLEAVDGVLLLDAHNLYCQIHNWNLDISEIMKTYPTHRVREVPISGGSWSYPTSSNQNPLNQQQEMQANTPKKLPSVFRRDTHDNAVPSEALEVLKVALQLCPNVEVVVFERLGNTILNDADIEEFREDFYKIKKVVDQFNEQHRYVMKSNFSLALSNSELTIQLLQEVSLVTVMAMETTQHLMEMPYLMKKFAMMKHLTNFKRKC